MIIHIAYIAPPILRIKLPTLNPPNPTPAVVPHVTNTIQEWIMRVGQIPADGTDKKPQVCIVEV